MQDARRSIRLGRRAGRPRRAQYAGRSVSLVADATSGLVGISAGLESGSAPRPGTGSGDHLGIQGARVGSIVPTSTRRDRDPCTCNEIAASAIFEAHVMSQCFCLSVRCQPKGSNVTAGDPPSAVTLVSCAPSFVKITALPRWRQLLWLVCCRIESAQALPATAATSSRRHPLLSL